MAKIITKAAAGLALVGILSASAPAKADVFDTLPDYSYVNNSAYVETHQEESPSQAFERVLEPSESAAEAPFVPQVDLFGTEDLRIPAREITVEDYLNENNIDFNSEYTTSWWEYPINAAGGFMLTLVWHEFGHYAMAGMFGAKGLEMHIFDSECGESGLACVKYIKGYCRDRLCRDYVSEVSQLQETIISAAGTGFTTMGNVGLTALLQSDSVPDWSRSFIATTSLMMMADRHRYIWSSAIKHWAGMENTGSDIDNIITTNFSSPEGRDAAYGILVAASAIELALRWEEIWYLANTIVGRQVEVPEGLGIMPGLYPYGSTLMLGASGEF